MSLLLFAVAFATLLLIQNVFQISFPFAKVSIGVMLVIIGIQIILASFDLSFNTRDSDTRVILGSQQLLYPNIKNSSTYYTFFGKSYLDLSHVDISRGNKQINIVNIFGYSIIAIDLESPLVLKNNFLGSALIDHEGQRHLGGEYSFKSRKVGARPTNLTLNIQSLAGLIKIINTEK